MNDGIKAKLRDYQIAPSMQLHRALTHGPSEWGYPGAVDLSDVGVGKGFMDLAAMLATGRKVGVLTPVVGIGGWEATFRAFGAEPAFIETIEACRMGVRPGIVRLSSGGFQWQNSRNVGLILDEAQSLRNANSLNSDLVRSLISSRIPAICASATLAISPVELFCAGQITGLHSGGDSWEEFLRQNACAQDDDGRWKFDTRRFDKLRAIHQTLIPQRGCRVSKDDIGEQPGTTIRVLPIEVAEKDDINRAWKDAGDLVRRMGEQGCPEWQVTNARRAAYTAIWKKIEMALVPHISRRIQSDLAAHKSVVAFFNFTDSRLAMGRLLRRSEGFYGGQSQKVRDHYTREFQANRLHVLLNQIKAGGASVSLHDIHGERPRVSYIFPGPNPVAMGQAPGRVDRFGGKSHSEQWVPCCAGTMSERMVAQTAAKLARMSALHGNSP